MLSRFDDGPELDLPAPDIVNIGADTAAVPVINDTATLDVQWVEASAENLAHE